VQGGIRRLERGKKRQKIEKTINLRGGGIALPHPEVHGGIRHLRKEKVAKNRKDNQPWSDASKIEKYSTR